MKHCRKAAMEPGCLSEFREQHPDADWEDFRREAEGRSCYEEILGNLRNDQWGLCAYCEIRLERNDERVEHFHPKSDKSDGRNHAFEWGNLWLVCKGGSTIRREQRRALQLRVEDVESCDHRKGNKPLHELILSPDKVPAFPRLFRYLIDGPKKQVRIEIDVARCDEANVGIEKVKRTVAELNLNCRRLTEARFRVYLDLENEKQRLRESSDIEAARIGIKALAAKYLDPDDRGRRRAFFTLIRERLGRAAEDHLREVGYQG